MGGKEEDERVIDKVAEKMYYEAESERLKEAMKAMALKAVDELTRGIEEAIAQVGSLATEYANLSLSGSFAGQIEKSIKLIALNIEKMQHDGSNPEMIGRLEKSMSHMQVKLDILRVANQKTRTASKPTSRNEGETTSSNTGRVD